MLSDKWRSVRRSEPCPICGRPDWCQVATDGRGAICKRVESNRAMKGGGWFHHLNTLGAASTAVRSLPPRPAPTLQRRNDLHLLAKSFATAMAPQRLDMFAHSLGLTPESLKRLDVGWCIDEPMLNGRGEQTRVKRCFSFPMRSVAGDVVGLRMRSISGRKFAFTGGAGGLFIPRGLNSGRVYLLEGPTDTAAALDMGLNAIGRESCSAGVQLIIDMLKKWRFEELVIFSQRDEAKLRNKQRPDLGVWYPAQEGAEKLAVIARVYCPIVRVIMPPIGVKDVGIWLQRGGTGGDVEREVLRTPSRILKINKTVLTMEGAIL
jgi:hypothetical protein